MVGDALTALALPGWGLVTAVHPRLRGDLRQRWGAVPPIQPGAVWLHGASMGEVGAALGLAAALRGPVLLTSDTDTGIERARSGTMALGPRVVGAARPVDHPWTLAPIWAEARPRAVVFIEGTWWPALARHAAAQGVPVVRASTRLGTAAQRLPAAVLRRWWGAATHVWARSAPDVAPLQRVHGVPVRALGDLKEDAPLGPSPLRAGRPRVIGVSTRPGDEVRLLRAVDLAAPQHQLWLAPRHLHRIPELAAWLDGLGRSWARRTQLDQWVPDPLDVVLIDTLGELGTLMSGADCAIIGGTFDAAVGGHSPLEARRAGVRVVAGPYRHAQAPGAFKFAVDADPDHLDDSIAAALRQAPPPALSGGAAERYAEALSDVLAPPAAESSPRPWAAGVARAFGQIGRARNLTFDRGWRRSERVGVPVISVGSTNARSPGRTSTVRWVVLRLLSRGHRVGVALRGYRRVRTGRDVRTSADTRCAEDLGDEGALLAAAGALVAAGPDRVRAARALVELGATVVVLDDGLQHRQLYRDLDLAVVDARWPGARGLLPAGERRELEAVPGRAHRVVVHHGGGAFEVPGMQAVRQPGPWRPCAPAPGPVAAFCGIGRGADFLGSLERPVARARILRDHQPLDEVLLNGLLRWAQGLPLVCTAKDVVRLPAELRGAVHWRDVDLALPDALLDGLL